MIAPGVACGPTGAEMLSTLTRSAAALALLPLRTTGFVAQMSAGGGVALNVLGTPLKVTNNATLFRDIQRVILGHACAIGRNRDQQDDTPPEMIVATLPGIHLMGRMCLKNAAEIDTSTTCSTISTIF